jgi:DNA-directed RNA polymerase specialized sigma subunit
MTVEQLKKCYPLRKELALTVRRMEASVGGLHQERLRKKADALSAEIDAVMDYIESLESSLMRQVLTLRYFEGQDWKAVGAFVGLSRSQLTRILNKLFPK